MALTASDNTGWRPGNEAKLLYLKDRKLWRALHVPWLIYCLGYTGIAAPAISVCTCTTIISLKVEYTCTIHIRCTRSLVPRFSPTLFVLQATKAVWRPGNEANVHVSVALYHFMCLMNSFLFQE